MIVADAPEVLLVNKELPVKSLGEFMALARKKGEEVTIDHAGVGSISYLTYLLYDKIGNPTSAVPIPYRGNIEADKDLVGGRISAAFNWTIHAAPYVTSGQLWPFFLRRGRRACRIAPDSKPIEG
jgi:tripartite-type tricarboxylate transporter receptor subunit TctC